MKVVRPPLPAELPRYLRWIIREPARALEPFLGLCIEAAVRCSKLFEGGEPVGALAHRDRPHFHLMKPFGPAISFKGPFTNDVSIAGEGGGWPISDDRRRLRDLYTKNSDSGGGLKSQKFN